MPQRPPSHRPPAPARPAGRRPSAARRGYGRAWRAARLAWLAAHPLCVRCLAAGRTTAATVVDHVTPHRGDHGLLWSEDNWQSLCGPCHNAKTAREDGGFGRR